MTEIKEFRVRDLRGWRGFEVSGKVGLVMGEPRVLELHVVPVVTAKNQALTSSRLRTLPLSELAWQGWLSEGPAEDLFDSVLDGVDGTRHDKRAIASVEQVAALWNAAYERGAPPRGTVCDVLNITARTADRYIKRAREMGLITAETRRVRRRDSGGGDRG